MGGISNEVQNVEESGIEKITDLVLIWLSSLKKPIDSIVGSQRLSACGGRSPSSEWLIIIITLALSSLFKSNLPARRDWFWRHQFPNSLKHLLNRGIVFLRFFFQGINLCRQISVRDQ